MWFWQSSLRAVCGFWFLFLFFTFSFCESLRSQDATTTSNLSEDVYLKQALDYNLSVKSSEKQKEASKEMESSVDQVTASQIKSTISHTQTKQVPEQASINFDSATIQNYSLEWAKIFKSGTRASAALSWEQRDYKDVMMGTQESGATVVDIKSASFNPNISLSQSLWQNSFGRSFSLQEKALGLQSQASGKQLEATVSGVKTAASSLYYALAFAKDRVSITEKTLANAQRIYDFVKAKFDKNLYEKSDLLQAEALLTSKKLELHEAKTALSEAAIQFNSMRGIQKDSVEENLISFSSFEASVEVASYDVALRKELQAFSHQLEASNVQVDLERDKNRPELNAFAMASLKSSEEDLSKASSKISDPSKPQITLGLSFSMYLDRDLADANRRAASLKAQSLSLEEQEMKRKFTADLQSLQMKLSQAKQNFELAKSLERVQKSRVENEQKEFRNGRSTTYQLLLATQDSALAELGRLKSAFELKSLLIQLSPYSNQ